MRLNKSAHMEIPGHPQCWIWNRQVGPFSSPYLTSASCRNSKQSFDDDGKLGNYLHIPHTYTIVTASQLISGGLWRYTGLQKVCDVAGMVPSHVRAGFAPTYKLSGARAPHAANKKYGARHSIPGSHAFEVMKGPGCGLIYCANCGS